VLQYFQALQNGDAAAALGFGTVPAGSHDLLTPTVLAAQNAIAPIDGVAVKDVLPSGDSAVVDVTYTVGRQAEQDSVSVARHGHGWRLDDSAIPVHLNPTGGSALASFAGDQVPGGDYLMFPGAVPVTYDTPDLELVPYASVVRFVGNGSVDVEAAVTAVGMTAVVPALRGALAQCLAGRSDAQPLCPVPDDDQDVPGSLRGTVTGVDPGKLDVTVVSADGRIDIAGTVSVKATYQELDRNNIASRPVDDRDDSARLLFRGGAAHDQMGCVVRLAAIGVAALVLFGAAQSPAAATPGPPGHGEWYFDTWHVQSLWAQGARGQGIVIGELDTGVNASLPALSQNVLRGKDFGDAGGDGRVDRDSDPFGHGTAMASLMVAHAGQDDILGLAPDARVLPVALPITGTTDDAGGMANGDLVHGISWAVDHGARIISMSLGAPMDSDGDSRSCTAEEQQAIDYALSKGVIVVASGGNSGESGSPVEEPSVCLGVISVGAQDSHGAVPTWSSRHPYLTVTAPGANVPTIGRIAGQAYYGDGTSQAAAITSAGLALVWSKYPKLTGRQVVARLLATLDGRRATRSAAGGYGGVDIARAVTANVPVDAPNPVFAAADPFLAYDKAKTAKPAVPKPRRPAYRDLPGGYSVAVPSGPLSSGAGLAGVVVAALGLLGVVLLVASALRRRFVTR